jgi:hypothetical protein
VRHRVGRDNQALEDDGGHRARGTFAQQGGREPGVRELMRAEVADRQRAPLIDGCQRVNGRTRTGIRPGEKVSAYKRLTVRLPGDVRLELQAAAGALRRPEWRVLVDAIRAYVGSGPALTDEERRVVRAVLRLHEQ